MNESVNESEFVWKMWMWMRGYGVKMCSAKMMQGIITGQEKNYHASPDVK